MTLPIQSPARHKRLTPRRIHIQLLLLAITLWSVAVVYVATPNRHMRSGQIKGTDFVHFYTLARLGALRRSDLFADADAQRRVQLEAVPESFKDRYPPAYGPQVALLLSPLGHLSYEHALSVWLTLTVAGYVGLVMVVRRRDEHLMSYRGTVLLGAIASPVFWNLILHGQLSILALAAVVGAFVALRAHRPLLCGAALGLLGYKPPLLVPILCTLLLARAWRPLAGALATAGGQVLLAGIFVGSAGLRAYAQLLLESPRLAAELISKPEQMHSLRAFWLLLVPNGPVAAVLYGISAVLAVASAAAVWRRSSDASIRMAALILATVLAAPHLYVYDLIVLTPVWMWLVGWYLSRQDLPPLIGRVLYAGYVTPLLTVITRVTRLQLSVLCFGALLWWVRTLADRPHDERG